MTFADIAVYSALVMSALTAVLLAYFFGRRLVALLLSQRIESKVKRAEEMINKAREEKFASMERLLFQLGSVQDTRAVEAALELMLEKSEAEAKPQLAILYKSLGLIDRYLKDLREATKWTDRATAARVLGQLRVVEAIPGLVERLRDPHEDPRTVKIAAASALGEIRSPDAVPLLIKELETLDEWASPRLAEVLVSYGSTAVQPLLRALDDEAHTNARVWAAQVLGRTGDQTAIGSLIARLRDRSEHVRMSVAEALGRLGNPRAVNDLVQVTLTDPVPSVRAEAARSIGILGEESAVHSLINLLSDPDYWTRIRAIEAIEMIAPKDPTALDTALRDASPEVRSRAAIALQRIGFLEKRVEALAGTDREKVEQAHQTLVEMGRAGLIESTVSYLEHPDLRIRSRMAAVLGEVGDLHALPSLRPLVKDPEWPVRLRAVEAIAQLRPPEGVRELLPALSDPEETVRAAAAQGIRALGLKTDGEGVGAVLALFETDNAEVRSSVIECILQTEDPAVDATLARAAVDPNEEVRIRALDAINARASQRWVEILVRALGDSSTRVRSQAARALGRIGSPTAIDGMIKNLATPDREFREALAGSLAALGAKRVIELARGVEGKEAALALAWALGKTGEYAAVPELGRLASDIRAEVRASAAGALGKIRSKESEDLLGALLSDRNERVRAAAANALGAVDTGRSVERLIAALDDPDAFVRGRALIALGRIATDAAIDALARRAKSPPDPSESAHLAIACGIAGGEVGFRLALSALSSDDLRQRIERALAQEAEEVVHRFRTNLHLDAAALETDLGKDALADRYAETLLVAQGAQERATAVKGLSALGTTKHRARLIDVVRTDPAPEVRRLALAAMEASGGDLAVLGVLIEALKDPSIPVRVQAAVALGHRSDPSNNDALLAGFLAKDKALDRAVIDALVSANRGHTTRFIDELMGHNEEPILRGGASVLGELADPAATRILDMWRASGAVSVRAAAVSALGSIGTVEAMRSVMECRSDPSVNVRMAAVESLSRVAAGEFLDALISMCRDPSVNVRRRIAQQIGDSGRLSLMVVAETLVQDPDDHVRADALLGLLALGDSSSIERFNAAYAKQPESVKTTLLSASRDHRATTTMEQLLEIERSPQVRANAFKALALLGRASKERLLAALQDPVPEVRITAIEAAALSDDSELLAAIEERLHDPDRRVRNAVRKTKIKLLGDQENR
jgi:HEAT repeat protein